MLSQNEIANMANAALDSLQRRALFKKAGTGLAGAVAAASLAGVTFNSTGAEAASTVVPAPQEVIPAMAVPASGPFPTALDINILQFALNLEYVEGQFYANALLGTGLTPNDLAGGVGVASSAPGGYTYTAPGSVPVPFGATAVPFATPIIAQLAQTIAADEIAHVRFIKSTITMLNSNPIPAPVLDVSVNGAFTTLAQAAGIISAGQVFSPYKDENAFLLGGFIFEDVGVTAYAGAAGLISQGSELIQYAASILAMEAYHSGTLRTLLSIRGGGAATDAIANLRSALSTGAVGIANGGDDIGTFDPTNNVVVVAPRDPNALAFRRTTQQVLNVVYGNAMGMPGLFFPNGLNGAIR